MPIRIATHHDLNAMCTLAEQLNKQHHKGAPEIFSKPTGVDRDRVYWLGAINQENGVVLIAETETIILGFISARISTPPKVTFLEPKVLCRVGTIVVSQSQQHGGVGTQLMAQIETWALQEGASELRLEVMAFNTNAQTFYEGLGFGIQSLNLRKNIGERG